MKALSKAVNLTVSQLFNRLKKHEMSAVVVENPEDSVLVLKHEPDLAWVIE